MSLGSSTAMRQTDYRELGAAARPNFMAAAGKTGAFRATGPTCRSGGRRERSTSATGSSGSDRTGRRRANRHRPVSRLGAVAPVDGARSRERGARDRAAQGQHPADQGQPATNVPRRCQGFRAELAAQDISASAADGRRAGAQADAAAISAPANRRSSHLATNRGTLRAAATRTTTASRGSAAGRTRVFTGAAAADARALAPVLSPRNRSREHALSIRAQSATSRARSHPRGLA